MSPSVLKSGLSRVVHPVGEIRSTVLNTPSEEAKALPFYWLLPESHIELLKWRIYVRSRALVDKEFRKAILEMCEADPAFFIETFGYFFEPRPRPRAIPVKLYCDQVDLLSWWAECFGDRDCIAEGTLVLTDRGEVPIEEVTLSDRVWDGEDWVGHEGLIDKGEREVIDAYGVSLTPDHEVLTKEGWQRAERRIDREEVRSPYGYRGTKSFRSAVCVRMWGEANSLAAGREESSSGGRDAVLFPGLPDASEDIQARHDGDKNLLHLGGYGGENEPAHAPCMEGLRRAWHQSVRPLENIRELLRGYGRPAKGDDVGEAKELRPVFSRKLLLGEPWCSIKQSQEQSLLGNSLGEDERGPSGSNRRRQREFHAGPRQSRVASKTNTRLCRVYDLANAGPRHRFTVRGRDGGLLLVHNCGLEKSRGIGASWLIAAFGYWAARFHPEAKIAFVSKDEDSLDGQDSNSLLGKVAYLHEHMPAWFRLDEFGRDQMRRNTTDHSMYFRDSTSTIQGYVPTNEKLRSLRFTAVIYDEFAFFPRDAQKSLNASQHTTNSRYFISTWCGSTNAFHEIMRGKASTLLVLQAYWWNNPERWKGCYKCEAGKLKIIDTSYEFPKDYPFNLEIEGLLRSPYVDFELRRAGASVQSAMEELYGLQAGDGRKLFRRLCCDLVETTNKLPIKEGNIRETANGPEFFEIKNGPVKVFDELGNGRGGPFSAACDISFGRGASYSTLEVISLSTGEQVLDVAIDDLVPSAFAQYVYSILAWINGPKGDVETYLTWENNGAQGEMFGQEMIRLGYGNCMRRHYSSRHKSGNPEATYYGYRNRDGGLAHMAELERAVLDGEVTVRSPWCLEEMKLFDLDEDDKPVFPTGSKSHGDRVQALAMAWGQAKERMIEEPVEKHKRARSEIEEIQPNNRRAWSDVWKVQRF